jgi:hypothetical protein
MGIVRHIVFLDDDSSFDTIETYGFLRKEFHFSKTLIPYNTRNKSALQKVDYNLYSHLPQGQQPGYEICRALP